jgi:hypothetical protein
MSDFEWTEKEFAQLVGTLQRLARADPATTRRIQEHGVDVLPLNFYSTTPSLKEIDRSFEYTESEAPYLDSRIFDPDRLRRELEKLQEFAPEFDPPAEGDEENPERFFWKNAMFSYSDAMAYYCFIRLLRPPSIVEIGGGFSTLIAAEAVAKNGSGAVHCVEPYPRGFLRRERRIALQETKAEDLSPERMNGLLEDGSILFIDSTHTVKTGSDCLHIYLRLLPRIERDIFVHVHDVFLPFGLPKEWLVEHRLFWTEQYLLLAFLTDNPKASVLYGSAYNARWNREPMDRLMGGKQWTGGGSLWFRYDGRARSR